MLDDEELERRFPLAICPHCDAALGARLLMIDRLKNPKSFWAPRSYWRHLQEFHPLPCDRVVAAIPSYLALALGPPKTLSERSEEERVLLHLGACRECSNELLRHIYSDRRMPVQESAASHEG